MIFCSQPTLLPLYNYLPRYSQEPELVFSPCARWGWAHNLRQESDWWNINNGSLPTTSSLDTVSGSIPTKTRWRATTKYIKKDNKTKTNRHTLNNNKKKRKEKKTPYCALALRFLLNKKQKRAKEKNTIRGGSQAHHRNLFLFLLRIFPVRYRIKKMFPFFFPAHGVVYGLIYTAYGVINHPFMRTGNMYIKKKVVYREREIEKRVFYPAGCQMQLHISPYI